MRRSMHVSVILGMLFLACVAAAASDEDQTMSIVDVPESSTLDDAVEQILSGHSKVAASAAASERLHLKPSQSNSAIRARKQRFRLRPRALVTDSQPLRTARSHELRDSQGAEASQLKVSKHEVAVAAYVAKLAHKDAKKAMKKANAPPCDPQDVITPSIIQAASILHEPSAPAAGLLPSESALKLGLKSVTCSNIDSWLVAKKELASEQQSCGRKGKHYVAASLSKKGKCVDASQAEFGQQIASGQSGELSMLEFHSKRTQKYKVNAVAPDGTQGTLAYAVCSQAVQLMCCANSKKNDQKCAWQSTAKCVEVIAPANFCIEGFGKIASRKWETSRVCVFSSCEIPSSWLSPEGTGIDPSSWCLRSSEDLPPALDQCEKPAMSDAQQMLDESTWSDLGSSASVGREPVQHDSKVVLLQFAEEVGIPVLAGRGGDGMQPIVSKFDVRKVHVPPESMSTACSANM